MTVNIKDKIKCKYSKKCSKYSVWHGEGQFSDCVNCKHNEYREPKKKSYYFPSTGCIIVRLILTAFVILLFCLLGGICI